MLPVVTVKNATKQNILQISNGEISDAQLGVAGKVGQRILTPADFTYTYQGTETNLTGADTGKYAITLNDAGRKQFKLRWGQIIFWMMRPFSPRLVRCGCWSRVKIASGTVTYNGKPQGTSVTTGTVYDHLTLPRRLTERRYLWRPDIRVSGSHKRFWLKTIPLPRRMGRWWSRQQIWQSRSRMIMQFMTWSWHDCHCY